MKYYEKYKENNYDFPHELNPNKKDMAYCVAVAEAIYSMYLKNKTGIFYSSRDEYDMLRSYGRGEQSSEKYKQYFMGERTGEDLADSVPLDDVDRKGGWNQTPSGKRKGYMNILWDVISMAPKVRSGMIGKFQEAEYDVTVNPVDAHSGAEIETKKYKLWFIRKHLKFLQQYYKRAGVAFQEPEFLPESIREMELYEERGGFKPQYAKVMEQLIVHTLHISEWDTIKDSMVADAVDLGIFGCKEYYDEECKKYKARLADPNYSVVQYSKYNDFRDSEFAGEFVDYTVGQLRVFLKKEGMTETQIRAIAKSFSDYKGNPSEQEWSKYGKQMEQTGSYGYDFYKVSVFEAEWIDNDASQKLIITNKDGLKKAEDQEYGTKNKETDKRKTVTEEERYRYECSWVVGTKYAFNFGRAYDILRPEKRSVALSYHFYRLNTKSITSQLLPIYDNFAILWYKYQNAIATAVPKGYLINYDSIKNITVGGEDEKGGEKEFFKRFLQTGVGIFKETNAMNVRNTQMKPIIELMGGMGVMFEEIRAGFLLNISLVENLTGINPLTLGTVNPEAPVKTSEIGVATTNDTLRPILRGYLIVKEMFSEDTVLWIQMKVKDDENVAKAYEKVIGKEDVQVLKTAEGNNVRYGLNLEARPTSVEKKEILESAKESLRNGRDGKPGITEADYFLILQIITSGGSYKQAEMILEDRIRRATKEAHQRAQETTALQQEMVMKQKKMEIDGEVVKINAQKRADIEVKYMEAVMEISVKSPDQQMRQKEMMELKAIYDATLSHLSSQQQQGAQGGTPPAQRPM